MLHIFSALDADLQLAVALSESIENKRNATTHDSIGSSAYPTLNQGPGRREIEPAYNNKLF